MTIQNKRIVASILFVLISFGCMASGLQGPPDHANNPPHPNGGPGAPPPPPFPIDGGIIVGLLIGLSYGAKKIVLLKEK